jgi:hypothetical protein
MFKDPTKNNPMKIPILSLIVLLVSCKENVLLNEHLLFEKTWTFDAAKSVNVQKIDELNSLSFEKCTPSAKQAKTAKYSCEANVVGPENGLILNYNLTKSKEVNISFLRNTNTTSNGVLNQRSNFQTDLFLSLRDKWTYQIIDKEMIWRQGDKVVYFKSI